MELKDRVKKIATRINKELIAIRCHLHENPELSFEEKETSAFIKSILKKYEINYTGGWAEHGIVAEIKGNKKSSKRIALRADMDALPIQEKTNKPYSSKNHGVMHACGHDVHTTSLLGAAIILQELRLFWGGNIQMVFQPGEEKLPGGASILLKEGLFKDQTPSAILGQHVHPPLEAGKVGFRSGKYMASADEIYIDVRGKGGHAAIPQDVIDPVVISATLINELQTVISRESNPLIPSVLSFGKIYSHGGATNVIPDKVSIEGTLRTMDEANRTVLHEAIKKRVRGIARAHGAKINLKLLEGYPCLYNDELITGRSKEIAIEYLGKSKVVELPMRMAAEDFAYYSQIMPACFYRLGTGNVKKGITANVHNPHFDVDEKCFKIGAGLMAYQAIRHLNY